MKRLRLRDLSFRHQIVLVTMALTALGMLGVALGLQVLVHRIAQGNLDHVLTERADAVVSVVRASSREHLSVPDRALDPGVVVTDADGRVVAGRPPARLAAETRRLAAAGRRGFVDVEETDRLFARPFDTPGGERGLVVVSEARGPYERAETYVGLATLLVGILVVAAVGLIANLVTRRALAPVRRMAVTATDWSEHDLGRRFGLGPVTNELSSLGATLDGLLERVAMTIRAEQRLTAELAHELRTPLAAVQGSAELALLRGGLDAETREDLEQVCASARTMSTTITTLLELARDPGGSGDGSSRLGEVVDAVVAQVPCELRLDVRVEEPATRLAAPAEPAVRALVPVVENAVRHAVSRVEVRAVVVGSAVEVRVSDDGEGVAGPVRETLFAPGASGPEGGTGLGLGIARRVARSIGGEVWLTDGTSGAEFVVRLPRL